MKPEQYDVIVVGAGFAGLYALHRLRSEGFSVRVLEAGAGVGGTWYWNRYPGARCDIESLQYSYSFSEEIQQEWEWSELYAGQPEIQRYMNFVADKLDLWPDIQLNTRVTAADYDEAACRWWLETDQGATFSARFCVMATGNLSIPVEPDLPGLGDFAGEILKTHAWPAGEVDLSGKRVGLLGTGSSGVQVTPIVAKQAGELVVFQRTANYTIPLQNRPMDPAYQQDWKANYSARRAAARQTRNNALMQHVDRFGAEMSDEELDAIFDERWKIGGITFVYGFKDTATNPRVNAAAAEFVRRKIAQRVADPEVAQSLMPRDHPLGSKRLCADTHYYEAFNRDNVRLVDLRKTPLETIEARGVRTSEGLHELDVLILATGFDAMTGALKTINPRGRNGAQLREKWNAAPKTLMGLAVAGFPNMFIVTGPGSPSVFSNLVTSVEQSVDWIADCIGYLTRNGYDEIEARQQAEDAWFDHVNEVASRSLLPNSDSWYVGANVPGKPRFFMAYLGGVPAYLEAINVSAQKGYEGFSLAARAERPGALSG